MEQFTYNNIFETKGIEYLLIIGFFLILIPFWLLLNKRVEITRQISKGIGILSAAILRVPQGIFHSDYHTWAHLEKSGKAKIGVDDLLVHITGEVKFSNLLKPGTQISKGEALAEIVRDGKKLTIYSPVSGEIEGLNPLISEEPSIVNEDPYVKGWIYKVKPSNWIADTSRYHLAEDANSWIAAELDRLRAFLSGSSANTAPDGSRVVMQDGGELLDYPLSDLSGEVWKDFQKDFLTPHS